jgi:hypothetical protein
MMEVEFRNVTITVSNVTSAKDAYDQLTEALGTMSCAEWTSDTFVEYTGECEKDQQAQPRDTSELFPDGEEPCR